MTDQFMSSYDVVVVGGGIAGLSGALTLARVRRSVAVIDSGAPRSASVQSLHGLLARDGMAPTELLERGRAEVRGYGGHVVNGEVTEATRDGDGFAVTLADGRSVRARRLLVATGVTDLLPDIPGLRERWGRDVFHCPYHHGWEARDQAIGVLGTGPMAAHLALMFRQLSTDITYFTHLSDGPESEQAEQLAATGVRLVAGAVAALEVADDRLRGVRLVDGTVVGLDALAIAPQVIPRAEVLAGFGLRPVRHPIITGEQIPADPTGRTEVPGVWAAGNLIDLAHPVGAAASGANAGAAINADLITEEIQQAVGATG
ncbi:NAD(P)/FAD-dependent oxidoreductase [Salinispora oceanensis]|uniref:NAD(P)/FAD-dependent oxidoreductase n=1 Tax=Salinispora oceanensis TaxID=1050199 RepID=UPI0003AA805D|nr:NAD(P)/FAD-dependent oxidoreductase [Salinispora oceanensis]